MLLSNQMNIRRKESLGNLLLFAIFWLSERDARFSSLSTSPPFFERHIFHVTMMMKQALIPSSSHHRFARWSKRNERWNVFGRRGGSLRINLMSGWTWTGEGSQSASFYLNGLKWKTRGPILFELSSSAGIAVTMNLIKSPPSNYAQELFIIVSSLCFGIAKGNKEAGWVWSWRKMSTAIVARAHWA